MTNLEHLLVIDTICSEGSFQKASEKLHKVRSAISYSVKQVESHYSIQIFDRTAYRPTLTDDGRILLGKIRLLLKQANEFETFVKEMQGENETELFLGVSSMFPIDRISSLLIELKHTFPLTTIHLEIEIATGERMLLDKRVDIGILGSPQRQSDIDYQLLDKLSVPLVIASSLGLNDLDISEQELASYPQIIVKSSDRQSPDTHILNEALKWYVTDLNSKKALIKAGLGWGRVPLHMVSSELESGELVKLDTQGELTLPVYVAKLKNRALGPVAKYIWQHFS